MHKTKMLPFFILVSALSAAAPQVLVASYEAPDDTIQAPPIHGGPPEYPLLDAISTNKGVNRGADNVAKLDQTQQRKAALDVARTKTEIAAQKAMALYQETGLVQAQDDQYGIDHQNQNGAPDSRVAATTFSALTATTALTGPATRGIHSMVRDRQTIFARNQNGCGLSSCGAYKLLQKLCRSGCLEDDVARELAKDSHFSGCTGAAAGDDKRGMATSETGDIAAPQGVQLGAGGKHDKCIDSRMALLEWRRGFDSQMAMNGISSPREMLKAELEDLKNAEGKIIPALYRPGNRKDGIIYVTENNDSLPRLMGAIGGAMAARQDVACAVQALAPNVSLPGDDQNYKGVTEQYQESTKQKPCYQQGGRIPSTTCAAQLQATGAATAADLSGERQNPGDLAGSMLQVRSNQLEGEGLALQARAPSPCGSSATMISALESLQAVIDTPEFHQYVAALDEKTVNEVVAEVEQEFTHNTYLFTYNYNDFLHKNGHRYMYAMDGKRYPSSMKGALASVGFDKNTLLLKNDTFQMAGLSPLLDAAKLDAVEPAKVYYAINQLTAPPQANTALQWSAVKALPIAAEVAHE